MDSRDRSNYKIKLSPYAKTFCIESLVEPNSSRHNISISQKLYGYLDVKKLKEAFRRYISEHVILNSHILYDNEDFYWVKNSTIVDLEYSEAPINKVDLLQYINTPFNLCEEALYRFKLFKLSKDTYALILAVHHLLVDGLSIDRGLFELLPYYYNDGNFKGKYSIDEQIELIGNLSVKLGARFKENEQSFKAFWEEQLFGVSPVDLHFLKSPGLTHSLRKEKQYITREINFSFSESELADLKKLQRKYLITPFFYGQCILALLINRLTSTEKFVISYPVAIKEGVDFIYGAQVNTSLIVYDFKNIRTVNELLNYTRSFVKKIKSKNFNYYPSASLIKDNYKQLLNVFFTQAYFKEKALKFNGIEKSEILEELNANLINFLLVEQEIRNNHLNYRIRYNEEFLSGNLIENFTNIFIRVFRLILADLLNDNNKLITDYPMLTIEQHEKIIYEWNNTKRKYESEKTIHQLFEEQVSKTPNQVALTYKNHKLTYSELNKKANIIAHYLINNYNPKPDNIFILLLEKNLGALIAIFGVLKAGAAYVPVDNNLPIKRIQYITEIIKPECILTNNNSTKINTSHKIESVTDIIENYDLVNNNYSNPNIAINSNNLAYVVFTSGTTGTPKGVMIEHKSVINLITNMVTTLNLNSKLIIPHFANYSFDASVFEMFPILTVGGTLCIISDYMKSDVFALLNYYKSIGITTAFFPTNLFKEIYQMPDIHFLKTIYFGGEYLGSLKTVPLNIKIINNYGPSENTVSTTQLVIGSRKDASYIGKPLPNNKCYVVNQYLELLPIGAVGELLIGGDGLSRGYFNNINSISFIANPFQTPEEKQSGKNSRLYKSGDLVRWSEDGRIEFIGRKDQQIKIRGYRIELNEIQQVLENHPAIQQAYITVNNLSQEPNITPPQITSYYTSEEKINEVELVTYLSKYLPGYMIPTKLIYVEKFYKNNNGKIDFNKLQITPKVRLQSTKPRTIIEKEICGYFATVLGIENSKVSIKDSFFDLGGDSISAIKLVSFIRLRYGVNTEHIFQLKTPEKIARIIPSIKNNLVAETEQIKALYLQANYVYSGAYSIKQNSEFQFKLKNIHTILLSGATGYLGCHILNQLLSDTDYIIYLLIRAPSNELAWNRIKNKYTLYFGADLEDYQHRIITIASDIERERLNLEKISYDMLVNVVDSIIHCAALIKHFGDYDLFYQANVQTTMNLLELAQQTKNKDFHYISTVSVLTDGYILNQNSYVFDEESDSDMLLRYNNLYTSSKYHGEQLTLKSRENGISANIYRIGNILINSKTHHYPEKVENNLFFAHLKSIINLNLFPQEISPLEITPVDFAAKSIVKIFSQHHLSNKTYHIFNPKPCNLEVILLKNISLGIQLSTVEEFVKLLLSRLNLESQVTPKEFLMLYQLWLQGISYKHFTSIKVSNHKTNAILATLGVYCPEITSTMLSRITEKAILEIKVRPTAQY